MKLKKLFIMTTVCSMVIMANANPVQQRGIAFAANVNAVEKKSTLPIENPVKANLKDTASATIKLCNNSNDKLIWKLNSEKSKDATEDLKIILGNIPLVTPANTCTSVSLRGNTLPATPSNFFNIGADVQVNVNAVVGDSETAVAQFKLNNIVQQVASWSGDVTRFMTVVNFNNSTSNNLFQMSWQDTRNPAGSFEYAVQLKDNTKLKNLGAGGAPDYVLCFGGTADQCNISTNNS